MSSNHLTEHPHIVLVFCGLHTLECLFDEIVLLSAGHSEECADLLRRGLRIIVDGLECLPFSAAAILSSVDEGNALQV